jgi:hypothetical protein
MTHCLWLIALILSQAQHVQLYVRFRENSGHRSYTRQCSLKAQERSPLLDHSVQMPSDHLHKKSIFCTKSPPRGRLYVQSHPKWPDCCHGSSCTAASSAGVWLTTRLRWQTWLQLQHQIAPSKYAAGKLVSCSIAALQHSATSHSAALTDDLEHFRLPQVLQEDVAGATHEDPPGLALLQNAGRTAATRTSHGADHDNADQAIQPHHLWQWRRRLLVKQRRLSVRHAPSLA